ncbi:hypothetical protein, partial [Bartonella sp. AC90GZZY]|uniref:hypothetical protein n=1 Tax=Bartonella sp. AC90GZZY TaxID=3243461 RepID=UPI0035CFD5A6
MQLVHENVELHCPDRRAVVAEGVVVAYLSTNTVDDKAVGDANIGVTLIKIHTTSYFPELPSGDVQIVEWPICRVKLVNDGRFLGDLIEEASYDFDESLHVIEDLHNPI